MPLETIEALKEVLIRIHDNSVYAFNRAKAVEIVLKRNPDLWKPYEDALRAVQSQDVHADFQTLLDKIR
jgi:hypothetical protein